MYQCLIFAEKSVPVQCALIIYEISIYQKKKKIEHLDATEKIRKKNRCSLFRGFYLNFNKGWNIKEIWADAYGSIL